MVSPFGAGRETGRESADNFLAFWLGVVDRYRSEIDRGLGPSILPVLASSLDDSLGSRYEEALREHLRRLAAAGELGDAVAVGPFWAGGGNEIDAVALAGRERAAVLVGESKWSRSVNAGSLWFERPALAATYVARSLRGT